MDIDLTPAILEFLEEASDLSVELEETLLSLEKTPEDDELINTAFRAAHTIKGSAGMFGFTNLVAFTHVFESVLMRLRDKEIKLDTSLCKLLLECIDQLMLIIDQIDVSGEQINEETQLNSDQIVEILKLSLQQTPSPVKKNTTNITQDNPKPENNTQKGKKSSSAHWHISIRFGENLFKDGMDPLPFINYLKTVGNIISFDLIDDQLPDWDTFDPEICYLGCEIQYETDLDKSGIIDIFEFIKDDCILNVISPHSQLDEYLNAFETMPESTLRLGDILLQTGAITQEELDYCLKQQTEFNVSHLQTENNEDIDTNTIRTNVSMPKLGELLVKNQAISEEGLQKVLTKQNTLKEQQKKENQSLRIDASKLDLLINQIGELVICGSSAELQSSQIDNDKLQETMEHLASLIEDVREGCLRLRMVPIGQIFTRFTRVVRDLSEKLDKDIELKVSGEDTEMDKSMVEKISDPLMHLIRNSIDHGIESKQDRVEAGKTEQGHVALTAYHDSGNVIIEIKDDGRGLQKDKILQKAYEKDIISTQTLLTDEEIYRLILAPGFSTADEVSDLSGRGVGMDVVNRNIESMRGTTEISSEFGKGTTIRIILPLTLAIIDGFMMEVSNQVYVIPLELITECVESKVLAGNDKITDFINLRGEVLPVIRLRQLFGISGHSEHENVIVVQSSGIKAGLVVDQLHGEFQTVIKPISSIFRKLSWLAGSTVLGSGEIALILDVPGLFKRMKNELIKISEQNTN